MRRVKRKFHNETLWFISYSDLITAILAVLILIMSFSKIDIQKVDHINRLMKTDEIDTLTKLKTKYNEIIKNNGLEDMVSVDLDDDGLSINTSSTVQFKTNSAKLDEKAMEILSPLFEKIIADSAKRKIYIVGHTDDVGGSIRNWELSSQRSYSVLLYLIKKGVNSDNITIQAHASNKPLVEVSQEDTVKEKKEARAKNRRVAIVIGRSH